MYISGRPFVLRDSAEPRRTLKLSDRAENLEDIELRLKNDILVESNRCGWILSLCHNAPVHAMLFSRFGGLILTHNEVGEKSKLVLCSSVDLKKNT